MDQSFRRMLHAHIPPPIESVPDWWSLHQSITADLALPIDRAMVAGASMDRVGWAFASGYRAALEHLVPDSDPHRIIALAATEARGGHPRAIESTVSSVGGQRVLKGSKNYVTLGTFAEELLVVASTGTDADGRNRLVVVRVDANAPGVTLISGAEAPFAPELPHARVVFDGVAVSDAMVLPGDGYADYLKPFRTIEDIHVLAALGGFVLTLARTYAWPLPMVDELLAVLVALRPLAESDPRSPVVHVVLAGVLQSLRGWISRAEPHFDALPDPHGQRWQRDRVLMQVADRVRAARTAAAWTALG